ncbi:MAG: tetratricopeptide repeat protein [Crocinitomicaceae bacterium]|jgi:tetratricopeptide (TPR) repeat protein|nr:tetratricopeptide repeat protein [Crocinitomicaceae bacterium]
MFDDENEYFEGDLSKDLERFERFLNGEDLGYLDVDRLEAMIDHFLISGQYNKASKCASYALELFSFHQTFYLRQAQALSALGKLKEALNILSEIEKRSQAECELLLTKASIFSQLKDSKRAIIYFQKALDIAEVEDKDEIFIDLAMEYENSNQYKKAIDVLLTAIKHNPKNEGAIYEIAFCYDQLGEYDMAIKSYSDFIDENPYSYTSWYNLGNAYSKIENFEKAIWAYDYCILINPDFGAAHFNLGNAYLSVEKFRSAIEQFQKCIELDGEDPVALCYLGEAYEQLNELPLARLHYQQSMELAPQLPDAWLGMGIVHDLEGKTFDALPFILKALELDPQNAGIHHVLGGAYEKLNEVELAVEHYQKALELDPKDEECLTNLMELLLENTPLDALTFIGNFEEDYGTNRILPLWITNVYWYLGRKTDALYYFRPLFEAEPKLAKEIFSINPDLKTAPEFEAFL